MKPNTEKIIAAMRNVVKDLMTSFQSDFENYDREYIANAESSEFPMIWIVGRSHTYLLYLGAYAKHFRNSEAVRFQYVYDGMPYQYFFDHKWETDHIFLVTEDGIREINEQQARHVVKDVVTPTIVKWKEENGPLPTRRQLRLPIKFKNISLSELKGLIRECETHNDTSLLDILRRKRNSTRVSSDQYWSVSYDSKYKEFSFAEYTDGEKGLNGGIVFHGWPETGYQVNGSVQIDPDYGWSSHS